MSNVKVFALMAGMTALFIGVGGALGGQSGAVIAFLVAAGMNVFAYYSSATMVMRAYRAQPITPQQAPELYQMVDRLRQRAGLPMPTVAIAPHQQPNAFATGRNAEHAVVCVTQGILRLVSREELEGVIAHELAHIKNRDMLLQTVTATLAGAIAFLGQIGQISAIFGGQDEEGHSVIGSLLMAILGPIAATLIQLAISRQREFKADAVGADICGRPLALAGALRKLDTAAHRIPMQVPATVAPLAQVNPLSAFGGMAKLFSTHPSTEERVARLQSIAGRAAA